MKENEDYIVKGFAFFVNTEDDSDDILKVVCVNQGAKFCLKDWIGVKPEDVVIYWNDNVSDFLKFIHGLGGSLPDLKLTPISVEKTKNKIILA